MIGPPNHAAVINHIFAGAPLTLNLTRVGRLGGSNPWMVGRRNLYNHLAGTAHAGRCRFSSNCSHRSPSESTSRKLTKTKKNRADKCEYCRSSLAISPSL